MDDFNTDELKKRNQQMLNFFQANIDLSKDLEKKVLDKEQELAQHRGVVEGVRAEAEALHGDLDAERRERAAVKRRNADLTDRIQELERQLAQANLDKEQAQAETRELQGIFRPIVEAIGPLVKFFKELHDAAAEAGPELDGPGLDGPGAAVAQLPIVRSRKRRHQEEELDRLKGEKTAAETLTTPPASRWTSKLSRRRSRIWSKTIDERRPVLNPEPDRVRISSVEFSLKNRKFNYFEVQKAQD